MISGFLKLKDEKIFQFFFKSLEMRPTTFRVYFEG